MLLFLGDIHGNFNYLKWYIQNYKLNDCTIYQVGDFGIGFTSEFNDMNILGDLNKFLKERNIKMYAIRGNHDNPYFFDGHLDKHFDNLHLLADYTVTDVNGIKILGVGGATSIDRRPRLREMQEHAKYGKSVELHWEDEIFKLDEEKLENIEGIDILVTHTTMDFCTPVNKNGFGYLVEQFAQDDPKLYDDLRTERDLVTKMWDIIKKKNTPDYHFYGHFHRNITERIDNVHHQLLGINEFFEYKDWKNYEAEWEKELK